MILSTIRIALSGLLGGVAALVLVASGSAATYKLPPTGQDQWYWEIGPAAPGLKGLPAVTGAYPAPGSANIWDTDLFQDSNTAGIPTGISPVVQALHASGKYSICYVEAGAYQTGFPDASDFAAADYGHASSQYAMQGWPGEWWFDISGFANYVAGQTSSLSGAAVDIASGLDKRIAWCAREGQDALEPDDLDGYTNPSATGIAGGGWRLTQADAVGFERWLADDAHAHGLAIFQKNDPADAAVDAPVFDGMIIEECNVGQDACAGPGGDATPYLQAGKPVLDAEYTQDGQSVAAFCPSDIAAGIAGALFDVSLSGRSYQPCAPVGVTHAGGIGSSGGGAGGSPGAGGHRERPVDIRRPALSGTARQGDRLSTSKGTWAGRPTGYAYAWQRCRGKACLTVAHATRSTYLLGRRDVGFRIVAIVTARNRWGATSARSTKSAVVAARTGRSRAPTAA